MKQAVIVGLVCLNAALLAALAFGTGASPAHGQAIVARTDYITVTGQITGTDEALYVIDQGARRLAVLRFVTRNNQNRLLAVAARDLAVDFGRRAEGG